MCLMLGRLALWMRQFLLRRVCLGVLVITLIATGQAPTSSLAGPAGSSTSRHNFHNSISEALMPTNVASWKTVLDSRFTTGKAGTWPTGPGDDGTASLSGGRYVLHATDGYTTTRTPGGLSAIADGRIKAMVHAVGRGNVGVYGRWSSTDGQPTMLACWIRNDGTFGCTNWQTGVPRDFGVQHGGGIRPNADNQLLLQITKNHMQFQINGATALTLALHGNAGAGAWGVYVSTTLKSAPSQGAYFRITISAPGVPQSMIAAATQTAVRARQTATAVTRKVATARARTTATAVARTAATVRAKHTATIQAQETATAVAHATIAAQATLTARSVQATQVAAQAQSTATAQAQQSAVAQATQAAGVRATEIAVQAQIAATAVAQATQAAFVAQAQQTAQAQATAIALAAPYVTWITRTSGTANWLFGVSCLSGSTCVAVGSGGTILTSGDGGATWTSRTSGTSVVLFGVSCLSGSNCVAVGQNGTVLTSGDGGITWAVRNAGVYDDLHGVSCAAVCVAVGFFGSLLTSTDGGATWRGQPGIRPSLWGVSCGSTCVAVGFSGTILTSVDNGASWIGRASSTTYDFHGVSCVSSSGVCIAVSHQVDAQGSFVAGAIQGSADGGATWTSQASGTDREYDLTGVSCPGAGQCVLVGEDGTILTNNGGSVWTSRGNPLSGSGNPLSGINCSSAGRCVAVGANGAILTTGI
jgi:photosystem II stability/assembly factor-like uncharacterized protein